MVLHRRGLGRLVAAYLAAALVPATLPVVVHAQVPQGGSDPYGMDDPGGSGRSPIDMRITGPTTRDQDAPQDTAPVSRVPVEEPIDPSTYVCGPGDVFDLNLWGRQNLRLRIAVDLEGRVFVPKVGYVAVAGSTLERARASLRTAVLRYYPGLNFDLGLVSPRSFVVHIVENVKNPGVYVANPLDRVSKVLARAGDVTGSRRRVEIRRADGSRLTADLLLYDLTGDVSHNPFVRDGDIIRVPAEEVVASIWGAVVRPGRYEVVAGRDLEELVALAGGLRPSAAPNLPIRLVRRNDAGRRVLEQVAFRPGALPAVALRHDDDVTVPATEELQRTVMLVGAVVGADPSDEVTRIKRLPFLEGDTVRLLIERAGGIVAAGDLKGAYIERGKGDRKTLIAVDLEALLLQRDFAADRPVQQGDVIVVPYRRQSVAVTGAVTRPGTFQFKPELGARSYVNMAGGLTRMSRDLDAARIIRPDGSQVRFRESLHIQPGDTIVIPERNFSRSEIVTLVLSGVGLALSAAAIVLQTVK